MKKYGLLITMLKAQKKINYELFKMINSCFTNGLKEQFEKSTCLQYLELVDLRRNKLKTNGSINMHKDRYGYCVAINLTKTSSY